jgi:hypothetical protein
VFKAIVGTTPILLAATMVVGAAAPQAGDTKAGQNTAAPLTIVGCVVRNGSVDPDKGTRTLDIAPGALALTNASVLTSRGRTGSAPGTVPQEGNTGTIPQRTIVGGRGDDPGTMAFELTGAASAKLGEFVGRRVEVVGRVGDSATGNQTRGTTGTPRNAAPARGVGTREERPAEGTAHPSAELKQLEVVSFRGATGGCE